ncbi:MAG: twin-arginine translocase TatA/TatE family subunit [Alphaproteobacteria bacterium]|nr:twin-arginine translocase TatA/TatE family subunit [Alphaproteobacteria bacterium]
MFGRFGWMEILVIVVLIAILFGHNKIPGMMKNLADGLNVFKKEMKTEEKPQVEPVKKAEPKKPATKKKAPVKKPAGKKK